MEKDQPDKNLAPCPYLTGLQAMLPEDIEQVLCGKECLDHEHTIKCGYKAEDRDSGAEQIIFCGYMNGRKSYATTSQTKPIEASERDERLNRAHGLRRP